MTLSAFLVSGVDITCAEHIRRAHPEYYISKLPATEVSTGIMPCKADH